MKYFLITILLSGCANLPSYEWTHDIQRPQCQTMEWIYMPWEKARTECGYLACAIPRDKCQVISGYTEQQAKTIMVENMTLYEHESKHVLGKLMHPTNK